MSDSEYEIRKDVPLPSEGKGRKAGKLLRALRAMEPGSFIYVDDAPTSLIRQTAFNQAKRIGIKITTRKMDGGIGVWRLE